MCQLKPQSLEQPLPRSDTILDFGFWIVKALPVGSFTNSNVASLNPIAMRTYEPKRISVIVSASVAISSWLSDSLR